MRAITTGEPFAGSVAIDRIVVAAIGIAVIGIAATALVGWAVDSVALVKIRADWPATAVSTAVALLACGGALVALAGARPRWTIAGAAIAFLMAVLGGAIFLFDLDAGAERLLVRLSLGVGAVRYNRMSPSTAVAIVATSLSLLAFALRLSPRSRHGAGMAGGLLTLVIAGPVAIGYAGNALPLFDWLPFDRVAALTSAALVLLALAALAHGHTVRVRAALAVPAWSPWLAAFVVAGLSVHLWWSLAEIDAQQRERALRNEAKSVEQNIGKDLDDGFGGLVRFKESWEQRGGLSHEDWSSDAAGLIRDIDGLEAIRHIDRDYTVRWLAARGSGTPAAIDFSRDPTRRMLLDSARISGERQLSRPVDMPLGGRGFLVALPIFMGGTNDGFVVASFRYRELFADVIARSAEKGFAVAIWHYDEEVVRTTGTTAPTSGTAGFAVVLSTTSLHGVVWNAAAAGATNVTVLARIILAIGLVAAALTGAFLTALAAAGERARALRAANEGLEARVALRTRELGASERKFRNLFEHAPVAIFRIGPDGTITNANRAMSALLGYTVEELLTRNPKDFFPAGETPPLDAIRDTHKGLRDRLEFEHRFVAKDGRIIYVLSSSTSDVDERGRGLLVHVQDITARKAAEAQALRMEKMEALGTLVAGVGHEFNNALLPVMGLAELSKSALPPDSPIQENLDIILESSRRAKSLVERISMIVRHDNGTDATFDISSSLREVLAWLRGSLSPAVKVSDDIAADVGTVCGDAAQFQTAILSLVSNAEDAMEGRAGLLRLGLARIDANAAAAPPLASLDGGRAWAHVVVEDNGGGMSAATLKNIFQPFFTTKPVGEGTGLGLAVVHGVVERMGGAIDVTSEVGHGTRFDLYIPLRAISGHNAEGADLPAVVPQAVGK